MYSNLISLKVVGTAGSALNVVDIKADDAIEFITFEEAAFANVESTGNNGGVGAIKNVIAKKNFSGSIKGKKLDPFFRTNVPGVASIGRIQLDADFDGQIEFNEVIAPIVIQGDVALGSEIRVKSDVVMSDFRFGDNAYKVESEALVVKNGVLSGDYFVEGDLDHNVELNGLAQGGSIIIEGSISSGDEIALPAGGDLDGQIVVNEGLGGGVIDGAVVLGSSGNPDVLIDTKDYNISRAFIGDGAVGVIPYTRNGKDCFPQQGSTTTNFLQGPLQGPLLPFRIRHYGPVWWESATGSPPVAVAPFKITVRELPLTVPAIETDVTHEFAYVIDNSDSRVVQAIPLQTPRTDVRYFIRPAVSGGETVLRSMTNPDHFTVAGRAGVPAGTLQANPQVTQYTHWFDVIAFDFNLSGFRDTGDIGAYLADPVDCNDDGVVCSQDLQIVVDAVAAGN